MNAFEEWLRRTKMVEVHPFMDEHDEPYWGVQATNGLSGAEREGATLARCSNQTEAELVATALRLVQVSQHQQGSVIMPTEGWPQTAIETSAVDAPNGLVGVLLQLPDGYVLTSPESARNVADSLVRAAAEAEAANSRKAT